MAAQFWRKSLGLGPPCVQRLGGEVALLASMAVLWAGEAPAPAPAAGNVKPYLRMARGSEGSRSLEVAWRRLSPAQGEGPALWLVAVTHLGTAEYYRALQRFLDDRSVVLFEAVQSDEDGRPADRQGYSLQADLAGALGLVFQLEAMDYDRPHFQNSDLDLEQIARLLGGRPDAVAATAGEGKPAAGAFEFSALMQAMTGEGLMGGLARMSVALVRASPRLQAATKLAMIEVLGDLPNDLAGLPGLPEGMQRLLRVLIEERNRTVVRDVRKALGARPAPASVAVFYGAGHMADLERRLGVELGYEPVEDRWLEAFAVNPRAMGISEFEVTLTTRLVRAQLKGLEARQGTGASDTNAPVQAP